MVTAEVNLRRSRAPKAPPAPDPGEPEASAASEATTRTRGLSVETAIALVLALFGFRMGAGSLHDNSMFTHLRTGVDMVRTGSITRTDPYSFTAHGQPWVVQSWLAEWTYGVLEQLGGLRLVVLQQGLLTALLAFLVVRLARAGSPWRTTVAALVALGGGAALWSQRPLLFGLVCFALVVTVIERRRFVWLLLPIAWVWVNTHGSFVFGVLWLGAVAVGQLIDDRDFRFAPPALWQRGRPLVVFCGGLALAAVNPLGYKLLLFPLAVGDKASVFRRVVEWRSPNFQSTEGMFTLIFVVIALVILVRSTPGWRDILPVAGFLLLGFVAVRNLPAAAVVLAPPLGRALTRRDDSGSAVGSAPRTVSPVFVGALAVLAAVFVVGALRQAPVVASAYPEEAVTAMEKAELLAAPHRVATQDFVGNYLELRYGSKVPVFIDDRADMFPVPVSDDYYTLLTGKPGALEVLDRHRIDTVLWQTDKPLVAQLRLSDQWTENPEPSDSEGWTVFTRK